MIEFLVDEEYDNTRIDRYLRKKIKSISLSEIYKLLRKGKIKLNGKKVKQDTRIVIGDKIVVYSFIKIEKEEENFINLSNERIEFLKSRIVYENENLFLIDKLAGDIVHKGSGHNLSLLEEYRAYFKSNSVNFINRIDKATSGLVIGAKNIKTARLIAELIRDKKVEKKYFILVHGQIEKKEFKLENYLKKVDEEVIISNVEKEDFKKSISYFKKIAANKNYTLLEGKLETGRTHQLRVQLANTNNHIVGDKKYGVNDNEDIMYLYSYYLKIPFIDVEIVRDIPKIFINKINY